jgi:uncharacterized membrane protein
MDLAPVFQALEATSFATAIREGDGFPWIESVHVIAIVLVVGVIGIVDLRLLGVRAHVRQASVLIRQLLPFTWGAFAVAAVSGFLMFASNATTYAANNPFRLKLVLLVLAGLNMAAFHLGAERKIAEWDAAARPSGAARLAGAISLLLWMWIILAGRWIGFTLI